MKLFIFLLAGALVAGALPGRLSAQDSANAAAQAERQETEERYKRLNAAVEDLLAAQAVQQKRLAALADEIRGLREDNAKATGNLASRDELRSLAEKVQELDKLREADKKLILDEIKKLAKAPAASVSEPRKPVEVSTPLPDKGHEYTIQSGDTLSTIVADYRKNGVKTTVDLVRKANPKLDENRLKVGQKIFIPAPKE